MDDTDLTPPAKRWSLPKAVAGGFLGTLPGVLCWYTGWGPEGGQTMFAILIGLLGAFAGVFLTRPDVSTRRVIKGTAILTVAKAVPGPLRKPLYNELFREEGEPDLSRSSQADGQPLRASPEHPSEEDREADPPPAPAPPAQ